MVAAATGVLGLIGAFIADERPLDPEPIQNYSLASAVDLVAARSTVGCSQPEPQKENLCSTCF
jgi:hypothetical protein